MEDQFLRKTASDPDLALFTHAEPPSLPVALSIGAMQKRGESVLPRGPCGEGSLAPPPPDENTKRSMQRSISLQNINARLSQKPVKPANVQAWKELAAQRFDVKWERLPAHSPHVGYFHRGHGVQGQGPQRTYDLNRERLSAHCPYVGTFHRGHSVNRRGSPSLLAGKSPGGGGMMSASLTDLPSLPEMAMPPPAVASAPSSSIGALSSVAKGATPPDCRTDSRASGADTPDAQVARAPFSGKLPGPLDIVAIAAASGSRGSYASFSSMGSWQDLRWLDQGSDEEEDPAEAPVGVDQSPIGSLKTQLAPPPTVPMSPELCGLQSILPRQSGVRVVEKIGEGTFAKVVLAMNHRNCRKWDAAQDREGMQRSIHRAPQEGERIVLKCLKKDPAHGEEGLRCIRREVELHQMVEHPHIPAMYGFYEDEQRVTLILGFVEGRELNCALQAKKLFGETDAKVITLQIVRAVAYLHGRSICHRDVTPRNILVAPSGLATLIDLGLAVDVSSGGVPGEGGTMGFLAPETYKGGLVTPAVDVWALGCILYQMLHAFPPFQPHELLGPMQVEFLDDPSWGPVVSREGREVLGGMLDKDASQ
eukprot:CAMPEP_0174949502 /NCGR_PEP_ID=MMETSP1355-20121228/91624_1 /TAXON_ID=464990 /ORGANISM="Hemiselmis tepida, Strain CCMP443" /LENGTH=591 /DNA_ID=CAMNT_0016197063 /DNA_START=6 /DNA_END=1778 /DNA_ORIENTATION=-